MKYVVEKEQPIEIEIDTGDGSKTIRFYPTDLRTRRAFFEAYENLKKYKPEEIIPEIDENGVSNVQIAEARELERFANYFAEQFDNIFGKGTAEIIMDGRLNPAALINFMAAAAQYFKDSSKKLVSEYISPLKGGVMK